MKYSRSFLLFALLFLLVAHNVHAGQFKVLKTFIDPEEEGAQPANGGVVVAAGKLYGVTYSGGAGGMGVLYRMNLDGTGFQSLHEFSAAEGRPGSIYAAPGSLLLDTGHRILGTTEESLWSFQIADSGLCS